MIASVIALLLAVAKAIPAVAGLCESIIKALQANDAKKNEAEALQRRDEKLAKINDAIAGNPPKDGK